MKNTKAFTLIELLAVIIILGVLMIIAIPSVTEYIQTSRRDSYVTMARQYIDGAITKVNSAVLPMYDIEATYYYPAKCISLEKGGDSPFGELVEAYIVLTYDGSKYDYYWTSRDTANQGILLTDYDLLNESRVQANIKSISTDIAVGEKTKILLIKDCDGLDVEEKEAEDTIPVDGLLTENKEPEPVADSLYTSLAENAVIDNISSTYVSSSTGINFAQNPSNTNGKGLYLRAGTENNKYPIYYFRGAVDNNNVIFAGFCWKIVRTTETGGIKLIYNGVPTDGKCNNTGENSTIGKSAYNTNYQSFADVGYMYGDSQSGSYKYFTGINYIYGNKVTYSNGVYTLVDTYTSTNGWSSSDRETISSKYHYTCFSTSKTCSTVYYIFKDGYSGAYNIPLSSGQTIDSLIKSDLVNTNNKYNSTIKNYIDNWYATKMTGFTSKLEDTIWCNDKTIYKKAGFDPNNNLNEYFTFDVVNRIGKGTPKLTCSKNDSYTVNDLTNGNGALTYPVALLTADEVLLAGVGNSESYLYGDYMNSWYTMSPHSFNNNGYISVFSISDNLTSSYYTFATSGVRPSVSLKPNTIDIDGDGTSDNPYIIP